MNHVKDLWEANSKLVETDTKLMEGLKTTTELVAFMSKHVKYKHE